MKKKKTNCFNAVYLLSLLQNNMLNRRAFSDLIPENIHGSRRKEEARQSEFLRIGQVSVIKQQYQST